MTTTSRQMAAGTEPKPSSRPGVAPSGDAGDIFLTPRVVDTRAFEEFAGVLRTLIARAAEEQGHLKTAFSQSQAMRHGVEAATSELRRGLEQSLRASQTLDERLAEGDRVLARVEAMGATLRTIRDSSEELLAARIGELDRRIESALADAQDRLDHIALERATKVAQIEEAIEQRLADGERRARVLEAQFESRLGELEGDRADKFVRLFDAIEARLDEAQGRLTEFDIGLEERLERAQEDADNVFEGVETHPGESSARAESPDLMASRLAALENQLADALARVERLESANRQPGGGSG